MVPENRHNSIREFLLYLKTFDKRQFFLSTRFQLFLFTFFINFLFISTGLASPNEGSRYLLTKTISENSSFSWPSTWLNNPLGYWFYPDFGINNGFISDKAPGLSFLLVPIYLLAKILYIFLFQSSDTNLAKYTSFDGFIIYVLKIFIVLLASVLAVKLFDLLELLHNNKKQNLLITGITSLGSLFFVYTATLFPALITALLYIYIIYHLIMFDRFGFQSDLLIAGILTGFSVVVEYGSVVMIIWFMWYFSSKDILSNRKLPFKKILMFLIYAFIGVLPLFLYNFFLTGNPLLTSYNFSYWINKIQFYHNIIGGLAILLIDSSRGLFIMNPIIFLACIGFFIPNYFKSNYRENILIFFSSLSFIVFYAKNFDPTGGMAVGPRYIIALIPLLIIGLQGWLTLDKIYFKIISILLIFITVFNSVILSLTVGTFPKYSNTNPVLAEAIPNFFNGSFKPFMANLNSLLFFFVLVLIFIAFVIINRKDLSELFKNRFGKELFIKKVDEREDKMPSENNNSNPITNDIEQHIKGTLWLFTIFLILFLFVGTIVLSRENYLTLKTSNSYTDIAVVLAFVTCSLLISFKSYLHIQKFNFFQRQ